MKNKLFKIIGVILIASLVALISTTHSTEAVEPNNWNPVWELYKSNFGAEHNGCLANVERRELIDEYETILWMEGVLRDEIDALTLGDPDLEHKKAMLTEELRLTWKAYDSILKAITTFVKTHSGI